MVCPVYTAHFRHQVSVCTFSHASHRARASHGKQARMVTKTESSKVLNWADLIPSRVGPRGGGRRRKVDDWIYPATTCVCLLPSHPNAAGRLISRTGRDSTLPSAGTRNTNSSRWPSHSTRSRRPRRRAPTHSARPTNRHSRRSRASASSGTRPSRHQTSPRWTSWSALTLRASMRSWRTTRREAERGSCRLPRRILARRACLMDAGTRSGPGGAKSLVSREGEQGDGSVWGRLWTWWTTGLNR